jgi:hypothetical protein
MRRNLPKFDQTAKWKCSRQQYLCYLKTKRCPSKQISRPSYLRYQSLSAWAQNSDFGNLRRNLPKCDQTAKWKCSRQQYLWYLKTKRCPSKQISRVTYVIKAYRHGHKNSDFGTGKKDWYMLAFDDQLEIGKKEKTN